MISEQIVTYREGDTALTGAFVWDDTQGDPGPGVLVVHGGAGLDDHARGRARQLAAAGYLAFACDMYGDGVAGNRERVMATLTQLSSDLRLCQRAGAGLDLFARHPLCDGRIAAVGYCFGGMTVLHLARSSAPLAGVASIHGSLKTTRPAQPSAVKAKVLVCHGALDPHVPMADVNAFMEEMTAAGADWQLQIYGNAMHGFTHEDAAIFNRPGVAYNATADRRSTAALHRVQFQTWLYRIATNACLDELERRPRRPEPVDPFPDRPSDETASPTYDPAARYAIREGMELALLRAIQELPGRQRAVLIFRDVLGWTAPEVAEILESTVASVNSALQRARGDDRPATARDDAAGRADPTERELLNRYVAAFEHADMDGLVALLREDATLRMPPQPSMSGGLRIARFFLETVARGDLTRIRHRPTWANGRPAVTIEVRAEDGSWIPHGISVLEIEGGRDRGNRRVS